MLIGLFFRLCSRLPLSAIHLLGDVLGALAWQLNRPQRRLALRNLEVCYPELSLVRRRHIARASFAHYYKTLLECPLIWRGDADRVRTLVVESEGRQLVDQALAGGKGLVIAAMHLGSFEAGIIPMSEHYKITGMYKPLENTVLDALSFQGRTRFGGRLVSIVRRNRKHMIGSELLRALKRGEMIYLLPDRDPPRGQGVFVPYFGVSAHSPVITPRLLHASGAAMLICVCERLPKARGFKLRFVTPPPGYDSEDLTVAVTAISSGLESCVRACPEQNWWGYERFKRRPAGEPKIY